MFIILEKYEIKAYTPASSFPSSFSYISLCLFGPIRTKEYFPYFDIIILLIASIVFIDFPAFILLSSWSNLIFIEIFFYSLHSWNSITYLSPWYTLSSSLFLFLALLPP